MASSKPVDGSASEKALETPRPVGGDPRYLAAAARRWFSWIGLAHFLSAIFIVVILFADLAMPRLMDRSDHVMAFYVAGRLAAEGDFERLYPGPDAVSFRNTPFNEYAHEILPGLREQSTTGFMYPPVVAWMFAPLSLLPSHLSLLAWQIVSIGALALSCGLLARTSGVQARHLFFLSFLYFPAFVTVVIGQVGIVFGLLPLSAGYFWLVKGSPFAAGLTWGALMLKPQFLPVAGLMSVAYATTGRMRLLAGLTAGVCGWLGLSYLSAPDGVFLDWVRSLRVSDSIFSSGDYEVPVHLLASIPGDLMMRFPVESREGVKPLLYGISAILGLLGLWRFRKILRGSVSEDRARFLVFAGSLALLPLTSPHLLYYDLVVLFPIGMILLDPSWRRSDLVSVPRIVTAGGVAISAYLVLFITAGRFSLAPLLLLLMLLVLWTLFLGKAVRVSTGPELAV